jgi:hypothetical protein
MIVGWLIDAPWKVCVFLFGFALNTVAFSLLLLLQLFFYDLRNSSIIVRECTASYQHNEDEVDQVGDKCTQLQANENFFIGSGDMKRLPLVLNFTMNVLNHTEHTYALLDHLLHPCFFYSADSIRL